MLTLVKEIVDIFHDLVDLPLAVCIKIPKGQSGLLNSILPIAVGEAVGFQGIADVVGVDQCCSNKLLECHNSLQGLKLDYELMGGGWARAARERKSASHPPHP